MGRKKIYITDEEKRIAINAARMRYYKKNKSLERKKALDRYYRNKNDI